MSSAPDPRFRGRSDANRPSHQQRRVPQNYQSLDSRGPDERIRGTASQIAERYLALARDRARSEDRIAAESYYQYAEHYIRVRNSSHERDVQDKSPPPTTPVGVVTSSGDAGRSDDQVEGLQAQGCP